MIPITWPDVVVWQSVMREKEIIALALKDRRKYASFFEWPNKQVKELGIVQDFVEELSRHGLVWRDARVYQPDPPDCVCFDENGNIIALEVVELVSREAIERNQRGEDVLCIWTPQDIKSGIDSILSGKDRKTFNGGPYAEIAVVIHTDEPLMILEEVKDALAGFTFGPFDNVTKAFLTFSYMPGKGYQVLEIPVSV